jgi:hypothetical protein
MLIAMDRSSKNSGARNPRDDYSVFLHNNSIIPWGKRFIFIEIFLFLNKKECSPHYYSIYGRS